MPLEVIDATPMHIEQLLSKPIRQDDVDEWFAATGGRTVSDVLRSAAELGFMDGCRALLNETGECICLWGVTAGPHGAGYVWLVASEEAELHGRHVHRLWPKEIAMMHMRFSLLAAIAYGNNMLHLSWLEVIGFKPIATDYVGPGRLPFITHIREMPCAIQ